MPLYRYKAQNKSGKIVHGERKASDRVDLHTLLKEDHLALISASERNELALHRGRALHPKVLSSFCFKLSELLSAGVSLIRALAIISTEEANKPAEAKIYQQLIETLKRGNQLSQAMLESGGAFPPLLINMIKAAEEAGNLAEVCKRMGTHYDKEYKFNAKIRSATTYPKILLALIIGVVVIIVGFVLPQFKSMFAQMASLPLPTAILLAITNFVSAHWQALIVVIVLIIALWQALSRVFVVRLGLDKLKLKLPIIGKLNSIICTARFARTFASLYNSGINAITALQIGGETIGNAYIQDQFIRVIEMVRNGHTLSEAFASVDGFSNKFVASVRIGEESGGLEVMLLSAADTFDFEAEAAMQRMVGYLEPVMIIVMGVVVGFVMVAVITPIYASYSTIGTGTAGY